MDEHDEKPESLDRFWDPKLETLGELLDQLSEDGAMDLEELDGFFAALHCCPQLILPSEYLPEVLGTGAFAEQDEFFKTPEAAKLLFGLLIEHWNAVGDALRSDDTYIPLLLEDENGKADGSNWAIGFMRGVELREELWDEIFADESKFNWSFPILSLADHGFDDEDEQPESDAILRKVPLTDEDRETLILAVAGAVTDIYRYFAPHRLRHASLATPQFPPGRKPLKLGRNDPCYCGSGKKYKKCCGALPIN
jgi:uncharacterized protein